MTTLVNPYRFAPAPAAAVSIVPASFQKTDYANQTAHPHAHTYQSTTQDGTVYVLVGFICDATGSVSITPDAALTEIVTMSAAESDGTRQWWGYYKPSQADLNSGTLNVSFDMTNEAGSVVSLEVTGAHPTTPIAHTARSVSTANRSSAGPVALTATADGTLLVSSFATDDSSKAGAVTPSNTANWDTLLNSQPANYQPNIVIHTRTDAPAGAHNTPTYGVAVADDIGLLAFAVAPAG